MPKHLVFTVTNDLNYDQRMQRICQALTDASFEVTLIGRERSDSPPLAEQSFRQIRMKLWNQKGKLFYLEYQFRLFFLLKKLQFDLISAVDLDTLIPCYFIAKLKKCPIVFDAHEYFTEVPEVVNRSFIRTIWSWVARYFIPKVDAAYTVSAGLQSIFSEKYRIPFVLIRNLATIPAQSSSNLLPDLQPRFGTTLLYQGVLNAGRGLETAIKALADLPDTELWLAGEGDLSEALRLLVAKWKVEKQVRFLGMLTPEQLKSVTPRATIGLNMLENSGKSYYYSLANKTFDYIQAELPAIHMDFPEYRFINSEKPIGILLEKLEAERLVQAVRLLKNDPVFYQTLKENCQQQKKYFRWENEAKKLVPIYQQFFHE